ncbi:MAG TPA: peptidylprolyl isomerase [Gemmataceae bacterium]|jgi:hypothetical protein|nr:peptidylprolyl isomerase [Gemmataceae bacterium]
MSIRGNHTRILVSAGVVGIAIALVLWGRQGSISTAGATQPPAHSDPVLNPGQLSSDYSKQAVAYLFDHKVAITREDFGEYLIARSSPDRLKNMVNRCIIEYAAKQRGVEVTAGEVEADFNETLRGTNTTQEDFLKKFLIPFQKTLYEWKEDVIKPKLLMMKMCRERVKVTDQDLADAYEAYYGPQVHCRMIMWPKSQRNLAIVAYPRIRDSAEEFDKAARSQASAQLAVKGGDIAPFHRLTTGNPEMEKTAFQLKPGELSQVLETNEGFVVLKCVEQIPPSHEKTLDEVRAGLTGDIIKRKINQLEIPAFFAELQKEAHPQIFTKDGTVTEDVMSEVRRDLKDNPPGAPK